MIYFIRSGQYVKIGRSSNPLGRLRQVQTGNPVQGELLAVCPGGRNEEAAIHRAFAEYRVSGEWFHATPKLNTLIEDIRRDHPEAQLTPDIETARRPLSVGGQGRRHSDSFATQDWLDILWQSGGKAQNKGLDIQLVELGDSVGIGINGVVVKEGRPYLTATNAAPMVATAPAPQEEPTTP